MITPTKINPNFTTPNYKFIPVDLKKKSFRCCMCGNTYTTQTGNFLKGGASSVLWKGNNGYLPFCKTCTINIFNMLNDFYGGNEEHALRHACCLFDWYYCTGASAMTLAQVHHGGSRVTLYPAKANTRQVVAKGTSFLDTIRDEYEKDTAILEPTNINCDGDNDDFIVTRDMIKAWGKGYTTDEYEFLEEQYQDWCAKNVCNTKSQEEIYRNICLAQLNIRIAMRGGGKVSEAQKALQDLMSSAAILPKQTAENVLADTQTFGTLLKRYEENDPIPEPAEEWRDVDGIRRYVNTWFRGGLAKALKIHNENTELYEDAVSEMKKYTVEANRSQEQSNLASLFDDAPAEEEGGDDNGG